MTHHDEKGCCGSKDPNGDPKACCGGPRGWVTGLAIVVAVASLGYAATKDGGMTKAPEKPKADTSALIVGEDTVVATVNGENIHKSDVALAIKDLGANVPPESIDAILPAFVDQYINLKLINDAAEKDGVANEPEVQTQIASSYEQIVRAAYLRKLFDGKINEDTLKAAYKAKYEDQPMPQEVRARHILVDDEAKARELIAQVNAGADFAKLAETNSKDPSAAKGGDLGYFLQTEMVKEFGDAAFSMNAGQVTQEPVKTQFGWHVIKVEDKRQRAKPSYEEAKTALEQETRQALLDAKIADLRANAKIEIKQPGQPDGASAPVPGAAVPPADGAAPVPAPTAEPAPAPAPAQ